MTIHYNQQGYANVLLYGDIKIDMPIEGDMMGETTTDTGNSLMSSYPFVIGISAVTLTISIILGILLAKKRIKKGFDLYED